MKLLDSIDQGNTVVGKAVSWFVPLLVLELVYDTVARYVFNAPTSWWPLFSSCSWASCWKN